MSRGGQRLRRELHAGADPDRQRRERLAAETGTIYRDAPLRIALAYPNPYRVAMSSLGYQVMYRMMNARPNLSCERVVLADDVAAFRQRRKPPVSLESGRPLAEFDFIAYSIAYDLDLPGFFELLDTGGVPVRRDERTDGDPLIILGGPLTASNPLPLGPFIDLAVIGDGEVAVARLLDLIESATSRANLKAQAAKIEGVWVPELHGDAIPATQKVTVGALPAVGQIVTPDTEFSNMFLIEASRGCPRFCKFCLVRAPESPMREPSLEEVMAGIPAWAPRVGFVGAAVSEWTGIREAVKRVVEMGKGVGLSSLRAERLDEEFVDLLARGGYRTMTIAADAPSQRLRDKMAKGVRTRHLREAAILARRFGMTKLKMYVIVGLPGEGDEDITELIEFSRELAGILPLALGVSPLVPKLHTPLGDAPFAGIPEIERTLARLRRELRGIADLRSTSAKWAWIEYRVSQGAQDVGLAALEAWRSGGSFAAWKSALAGSDERGALRAAREHHHFAPAGMR